MRLLIDSARVKERNTMCFLLKKNHRMVLIYFFLIWKMTIDWNKDDK